MMLANWFNNFGEFYKNWTPDFPQRLYEHIVNLTIVPVGLAILIAVPTGILISRHRALRATVLSIAGLIQTWPSLALLSMLAVLMGTIGTLPAIIALVAYALFPIMVNTCAGLDEVPRDAKEAALGLGFTRFQQLIYVELPLAMPVLLAGIRTAAVIDVGIATLGSLVGAGGLGDYIITGLQSNNAKLTVFGGVTATLLALIVYWVLGTVGRLFPTAHRKTS